MSNLSQKASAKLSVVDHLAFTLTSGLIQNHAINPRLNLSGIFIGRLSKKVSGFS